MERIVRAVAIALAMAVSSPASSQDREIVVGCNTLSELEALVMRGEDSGFCSMLLWSRVTEAGEGNAVGEIGELPFYRTCIEGFRFYVIRGGDFPFPHNDGVMHGMDVSAGDKIPH